jgi:hypothetical protein
MDLAPIRRKAAFQGYKNTLKVYFDVDQNLQNNSSFRAFAYNLGPFLYVLSRPEKRAHWARSKRRFFGYGRRGDLGSE